MAVNAGGRWVPAPYVSSSPPPLPRVPERDNPADEIARAVLRIADDLRARGETIHPSTVALAADALTKIARQQLGT